MYYGSITSRTRLYRVKFSPLYKNIYILYMLFQIDPYFQLHKTNIHITDIQAFTLSEDEQLSQSDNVQCILEDEQLSHSYNIHCNN